MIASERKGEWKKCKFGVGKHLRRSVVFQFVYNWGYIFSEIYEFFFFFGGYCWTIKQGY